MDDKVLIDDILSHELTKKTIEEAILKNKSIGWVFDEIEPLIELIDDCTEDGSLIFDELEDKIYKKMGII